MSKARISKVVPLGMWPVWCVTMGEFHGDYETWQEAMDSANLRIRAERMTEVRMENFRQWKEWWGSNPWQVQDDPMEGWRWSGGAESDGQAEAEEDV